MTNGDLSAISMYQACLMHSRAERVLKTIVAKHLKNYKITRMEWIVLATLDSNSQAAGYSMSELSQVLDIKLSQLTILTGGIVETGLAKQITSPNDKRAKLVTISPKGRQLINKIEISMRQAMHDWLADIPRDKLTTYIDILYLLGKSAK